MLKMFGLIQFGASYPGTRRSIPLLFLAVLLLAACQPSSTLSDFGRLAGRAGEGHDFVVQPRPAGLNAPVKPYASPNDPIIEHPVPPISAASIVRNYMPRVAPPQLSSAGGSAPLVFTPPGPAFAWAETDNFLVLGIDRDVNEGSWRTDTIMIVGFDRKNGRTAVLSVPRDLYVNIPNYGWSRINNVDYVGERVLGVEGGGPALMSEVLNQTLGVATNHWVRVEMSGFQAIVDAIGGVTVHLDCPFYEPIFNLDTNAWEYYTLPAGDVWMDGETAYWFVRLRLRESDIGRSKRQRQFLWAMREQALNANLLLRFPELWSAFRETFTTDLSLFEMLEYARFGMGIEAENVRATGIALGELETYITDNGANVLRISHPARVAAVVNGVWDAPAMVDAYRQDATRCAPVPSDSQAGSGAPVMRSPLEPAAGQ